MQYHAPTGQFTITADAMKRASMHLLFVIKSIRKAHKLDPKGYDWTATGSSDAHTAESAIFTAAQSLGIDLGAERPGKLDVSSCT
jgi:hypothetical protein